MSRPIIVATLMAGVVGTQHYGLDDKGRVFLLDADGKTYEVEDEVLATKVREAIKRGQATGPKDS